MRGFANGPWSGDRLFPKDSIHVTRIEKTLYEELKNWEGFLGKVGQVYQNGFDLFKEEGRKVVHFRSERWLHSPFGAILDRPVREWVGEVSLREGDPFWKAGRLLFRKPQNGWSVELEPCDIVDLRRTLTSSPPGSETMLLWIRRMADEIVKSGRFEGMAGTAFLLGNEWPEIFPAFPIPISVWSRHALPQSRSLIEAAVHEDLGLFEEAWEGLLGLGPGLTPAGDDFLVGFLASHKLFSSSLGRRLGEEDLKRSLRKKAESKTNRIAVQFLADALEGLFSESLYRVFGSLTAEGQEENPERMARGEFEYFLKWGHSSGADTLMGAAFGLWAMIQADRGRASSFNYIPR